MSSPCQDPSVPPSQFSAALFSRLPVELRLHIMSFCQGNDLICLSLTSHDFRDLTLPMIPQPASLDMCDQNVPANDLICGCGEQMPTASVRRAPRAHQKRRHEYTIGGRYAGHDTFECRKYPDDHPVCRGRGCHHCMCISCPLHTRLRTWIGGDLRYCSECRMFTKRELTKKYKGRCLHGRPKVRKSSSNHWTAVKGRSYGPRWWRRWGTSGVDRWGFDGDKHKRDDPSVAVRRWNARVV